MPFAAALSEHPLPTHAVGEVVGTVLEGIGPEPDLAVLFVTVPHAGALDDILGVVREVVRPRTLLGCLASSVLGGDREVEDQAAISLWAGHFGPVVPVRLALEHGPGGAAVTGLPATQPPGTSGMLLLADPFTFPADEFLRGLDEQVAAAPPVIGGLASAAIRPGVNRLVLDDAVHADGAVGALIGPGLDLATVVSQGCRPIGDPIVVTRSDGRIVYELAGEPALQRLEALAARLGSDEQQLLQTGVHLGLVIDEQKDHFGPGDFLVRNVIGADRELGALAVGDEVPVGSVVQFQVRDASSADEDLEVLLSGHRADAALAFTCNGRGTHLFGTPDHDASRITELLDRPALSGMFCNGEIGPVGHRSFLHGFTASVALLSDNPQSA